MASSISLTVAPSLNPRIPIPHRCCCRCRLPHSPHPPKLTSTFLLQRPLPSLSFSRPRLVSAAQTNGFAEMDDIEAERRSGSSMPDVFRELSVEVPEKPVRWPWFIPIVFFVYGWRAVRWELNNWKNAAIGMVYFAGHSVKSIGKFLSYFMGDQIAYCNAVIEYFIIQLFNFLPLSKITTFILLTSAAVAVAEATAPNSVTEQRYLLTIAGFVGFGYNLRIIPDVILWSIPLCFLLYSKFFKKRNAVSAALPCAALLFSVNVPWFFFKELVMLAYFGLAAFHYFHLSPSPTIASAAESADSLTNGTKHLPWVVFMAGLSMGIHVGFKWLRWRHVIWMVA